MRTLMNISAIMAMALALSACSTYRQPYGDWSQKQPLTQAQQKSLDNAFNEYLRLGYIEFDDVYTGRGLLGSTHYAKKALLAARGIHPDPEELFLRRIGMRNVNELADARNQLEAAFARHARWHFPRAAADAQLAFDCWVEESVRFMASNRRDLCRTTFWNAITAMKAPAPQALAVVARPLVTDSDAMPAPMITVVDLVMPQPFIVFFDFDKNIPAPGAEAVLLSVVREYGNFKPSKLSLLGNADTKGTYPYNDGLSVQRVNQVRDALVKLGVPADAIDVTAMGERRPRVVTPDEVKEPANRYVTIAFIK